jgi:hypothetical protein
VPELERILSANTLTGAQGRATTELEKLDQLCIRLRSLEIREKAVSQKTDASEKWMQETLTVHLERDSRLAAYWHDVVSQPAAKLLLNAEKTFCRIQE